MTIPLKIPNVSTTVKKVADVASRFNPPISSLATRLDPVSPKPSEAVVLELQKCVKIALTNAKEKQEKNFQNLSNLLTIRKNKNFLWTLESFCLQERPLEARHQSLSRSRGHTAVAASSSPTSSLFSLASVEAAKVSQSLLSNIHNKNDINFVPPLSLY